jgi:hypothetical protein
MNRRNFLTSILRSAAVVAAVHVGLGNVLAEDVAVRADVSTLKWIIDPNCPPDVVYLVPNEYAQKWSGFQIPHKNIVDNGKITV